MSHFHPLLIVLGLLSLPTLGTAQPFVTGRVLDSLNQEPIPFATVYFDGTTIGEVTDEEGRFSLPLKDISLPAAIAVTHLNYRPAGATVTSAGTELTFLLSNQAVEIATIEVADKNQREENLREFRKSFLGANEWGQRATITNEERLAFDRTYATKTMRNANLIVARHGLPDDLRNVQWSMDGTSLTFEQAVDLQARSRGPLLLDLPDLGYHLQVDLRRFLSDYGRGTTHFLGTFFFQPYEGNNGKTRKKHLRNREAAYYNSSQHFLRSLYRDELEEQGYVLFEKVEEKFLPFSFTPHLFPLENGDMEIRGLNDREIVIAYYGDQNGRPLPPKRRKGKPYQTSNLFFFADRAVIRANGTIGDSPISFGGTIGSRGVAMLLPSDYRPGE